MITNQKSSKPVIDERQHADREYLLIDGSEEFYRQTGAQIIHACKMQITAQMWADNFRSTLEAVRKWAEEHRSRLSGIFVELRSDKVIFFIVPKSEEYDIDLGLAQANLDVELNTQCNIGYAETRQIPSWELHSFLASDAKKVWSSD